MATTLRQYLDLLVGRRPKTAALAKERLQLILAHERAQRDAPDFLPALQREIMQVVGKYFPITADAVRVHLERRDTYSVLELNVALPEKDVAAAS